MATKLVINGAYYYSEQFGCVVMVCRTGEFWVVDCNRFFLKENYIEKFGEEQFIENEDDFIMYDHEQYFSDNGSIPLNTEDFELLSDLTDLRHNETEYGF